jgi:hypothetical protein
MATIQQFLQSIIVYRKSCVGQQTAVVCAILKLVNLNGVIIWRHHRIYFRCNLSTADENKLISVVNISLICVDKVSSKD